ncbi:pyrimidine 5'-nucleotidase [Rhodobacteraceae bacterium NNCM2]|nr:pyrimidine 5'-nucleotidase [Coraliihabitans acroporae]
MHAAVETWIFDLDNTLYAPATGLLDQINARIKGFIMRELCLDEAGADAYRHATWLSHGITLNALVADHGVDAAVYLAETHDIDYAILTPAPDLAAAIAALPGRKIVHTNGARGHADRVLDRLRLSTLIDDVWAIEESGFTPKPSPLATDRLIAAAGFDPRTAVMIEDSPANLSVPKARGMTTVLVTHGAEVEEADHVDHRIDDLVAFLEFDQPVTA